MDTTYRRNRLALVPFVIAVALALAAAADVAELTPAEQRTLTDLGSLLLSCDAYRVDHERYPGPTEGFVSAEFLRTHLSPVYIRELPVLDAWGSPFRYAAALDRMAIVSHGPDRVADREYGTLDGLEPTEGVGDDLVWSDGHLVVCPVHICQLERSGGQKATMADLRSIGTAIEAFKIDNRAYPGPTEGYVSVATIRAHVEPIYIRSLPLADAWGNTFLYWSDGNHYRVVSNGWDGAADRPYDTVQPGTTTDTFASDIVFGDGEFLQRPEGEQH